MATKKKRRPAPKRSARRGGKKRAGLKRASPKRVKRAPAKARTRAKKPSKPYYRVPWWGYGLPASGGDTKVGTRVFYSPRYDAKPLAGVTGGDAGVVLKIDSTTPDPMLGEIPAVIHQRGDGRLDVDYGSQELSKGAVVQFDNGTTAHVPMWNLIVDDVRPRYNPARTKSIVDSWWMR